MKHRKNVNGAGAFNFIECDTATAESGFENAESLEMDKMPLSAGGYAIKPQNK